VELQKSNFINNLGTLWQKERRGEERREILRMKYEKNFEAVVTNCS